MPNWVYTTITFTKELSENQKEILEKIKEKGLCEYYLPMPKELEITSGGGVNAARGILKDKNGVVPEDKGNLTNKDFEEARQSFINEELYGYKDWYDWKCANYGTKWGDCYLKIYKDGMSFDTAWSPLSMNIIESLAVDFPDFTYNWEEEQGFGEDWEFVDGEAMLINEWDIPNFRKTDHPDIFHLTEDHRDCFAGYYYEMNANGDAFLGFSFEEALEKLKNN